MRLRLILIGFAVGASPGLVYYVVGACRWGPGWIVPLARDDFRNLSRAVRNWLHRHVWPSGDPDSPYFR